MVSFFDEGHARSVGLNPFWLNVLFFTLLSAATGQDFRAQNPILEALALEGMTPAALVARCGGERITGPG